MEKEKKQIKLKLETVMLGFIILILIAVIVFVSYKNKLAKEKSDAEIVKLNQKIAEKVLKISNLQKEIDSFNSKIEEESTINQEEIYDENKIKEKLGMTFELPGLYGGPNEIKELPEGININLKNESYDITVLKSDLKTIEEEENLMDYGTLTLEKGVVEVDGKKCEYFVHGFGDAQYCSKSMIVYAFSNNNELYKFIYECSEVGELSGNIDEKFEENKHIFEKFLDTVVWE